MGIATVAVFSEADREALHVLLADEAVPIGPAPAAESYLSAEKLIAAARATGAQAVHPGYGFLAENASFADACATAGLVFIGPSPAAVRAMGDKMAARRVALSLGVPVVPGASEPVTDDKDAARIAEDVGYVNAGTAEFLVDAHGSFYFLEMNARLQVEHPVTELVTGRDLVREQLRIAAGEKLGYGQEDIAWSGAAIECRINAEDPDQGFLPSPGCITRLSAPAGPWVRNDSGVYAGYTVPRYYDTLMAKLIVWAPDREAAVARMERALGEYQVGGVRSTIPVLRRILRHPDFVAGKLDTQFMERLDDAPGPARHRTVALIAAALAAYERAGRETPPAAAPTVSAWARLGRPGSSGSRPR